MRIEEPGFIAELMAMKLKAWVEGSKNLDPVTTQELCRNLWEESFGSLSQSKPFLRHSQWGCPDYSLCKVEQQQQLGNPQTPTGISCPKDPLFQEATSHFLSLILSHFLCCFLSLPSSFLSQPAMFRAVWLLLSFCLLLLSAKTKT